MIFLNKVLQIFMERRFLYNSEISKED